MCQGCVSIGKITQGDLDRQLLEGNLRLMPIGDRVAGGQRGEVMAEIENDPRTSALEKAVLLLAVEGMEGPA
jgi:hypothetical protein